MSIYTRYCEETFDARGRLTDFKIRCPEDFNFGYDVVDEIARSEPGRRALVWCSPEGEAHTFSFAEISQKSNQMANVMREAGIGRGDRVMLILKRHAQYWFAAIALHKLGAVMIPATHMLTAEDLAYRFSAAGVKAVVCTAQDGVPGRVRDAMAQAGCAALCWSVRGQAEGFADMDAAMAHASEDFARVPTRRDDPMMLYFTSGTTGNPKGVIHDFSYPLAHIVTAKYWQRAQDGGLHFTVAETGWAKASWGKLYGQWLVGCAVMVCDFDNFDPKQLTSVINRFGVTSFCAPPTVYRYLVRKGIPDMPTLRHASTAGEMLAPEVFEKFTERTGIALCEGYGQTETTLLTANFAGDTPVAGSMGTPSPMYHIELRDRDGARVAPGETGEVVIVPEGDGRLPGVFTGYLNNEEQYACVWRGGVYHTGDAAHMDEDGRYWFHGRFDDIIKTGGFRVGPYEIEHVLAGHPAVADCSVIGVPDALRGQAIKAVVQLAAGYAPTEALEKEIRRFCNARLAEYKWVRAVEFVQDMPRTISGKIRKHALRERA